ncbi:MAG: alanine racemase [Cyclobacteriaceae bacterium]
MKITKPTLIVSKQIARKNIATMQTKAIKNGTVLRPHFKTHQSAEIAQWFREAGIEKATVSSVDMACFFAKAGWKDLTIAFPYNPLEAEAIDRLANQIHLHVTIVSPEALDHLNKHVKAPVGYYLKIDVGTHRTGMLPENIEAIVQASKSKNPNHQLKGLLAHAGHSYQPLTVQEAKDIFDNSMKLLNEIKKELGQPNLSVSYGDTPTCSLLDLFPGVDELRPGNFVFYDTIQAHFGSCELHQVAVCLVCPVVAVHPERNEAVIYGGAVHLSKDHIETKEGKDFGTVVEWKGDGWLPKPKAKLARLSQEHGIISGDRSYIDSLQIGDLVGILPVHSCLAADLQPYYVSLNGQIIDKYNKALL